MSIKTQTMKCKRYYEKQCYSIGSMSQLTVYKIGTSCMNILAIILIYFYILAVVNLHPFNQVDIENRTWYNWDGVAGIAIGINFCGIFIVMAFVIDTTIKILILDIIFRCVTIIFDGIALGVDKQSEFECDFKNNGHATIITNNAYKIRATPIAVRVFLDVFHLIRQAMDALSLNIAVPIDFEAAIVAIGQLVLYFAVPSPNNTVSHHILIHNVCAAISYLLPLVVIFEFMNVALF